MKDLIISITKELYLQALEGEQVYGIIYSRAGYGKTKIIKEVLKELPEFTTSIIAHPSYNTELKILNKIAQAIRGVSFRDIEKTIDAIKTVLRKPKVLFFEEFHKLQKPQLALSVIKLIQEETEYKLPTIFVGSPAVLAEIQRFEEVNLRTMFRVDLEKNFKKNLKNFVSELSQKYGVEVEEKTLKEIYAKGLNPYDLNMLFKLAKRVNSPVNENVLKEFEVAKERGWQEIMA